MDSAQRAIAKQQRIKEQRQRAEEAAFLQAKKEELVDNYVKQEAGEEDSTHLRKPPTIPPPPPSADVKQEATLEDMDSPLLQPPRQQTHGVFNEHVNVLSRVTTLVLYLLVL